MSYGLIAILILSGAVTMLLGFRYASRSDPFSFLTLTSIPIVFLLVIRPIAYVFLEDFDGRYIPYRPGIEIFVIVTLAINLLAYLLLVIGYSIGIRGRNTQSSLAAGSHPSWRQLRKTKFIAITLVALGFSAWLYLVRHVGGLQLVLSSLADRNDLFTVAGGQWFLEITKALISVSTVLLACTYLAQGQRIKGWLCILLGCALIVSFGGRGAMMSILAGGLICYNYVYKRIRVRSLILVALVLLPLLVVMGEVRQSLRGSGDISIEVGTQEFDLSADFVRFSYLLRAFDYNVMYLQKYVEEDLSFIGEYPIGVTAVIPRSIYPDKADMLGSRLATALYDIEGYGITPSFTVGIMLYWGVLALPVLALLLGYSGARFWRYFVDDARGDPWRLTVYSTMWPVLPWVFFDLAGLLVAAIPILAFLTLARVVSLISLRPSILPVQASST